MGPVGTSINRDFGGPIHRPFMTHDVEVKVP
jgi:hypothetical protein